MDVLIVMTLLTILGLGMGSFAGATVWRLRAKQLVEDKAVGEKVPAQELKQLQPLTETTFTTDRSQCLHCHHQLTWYDMIPLLSWLSTGGRCRYCGARIGLFEPAIELATAALFVISYLLWPQSLETPLAIVQLVLWLIACVGLVILFAYDTKWFLLPNKIVFPLIAIAAISAVLTVVQAPNAMAALGSLAGAVTILSGMYLLLWLASKGRWIGFGDVKLGLLLALFLTDWRLAFVALFAANLIGCLIVLPGLLTGKLSRTARVPFGPLLIAGGVLAMLVGRSIVDWYMTILL
jgi:prepilin signal peptidase PulO-like enzyme (type II secretory pathway)